MLRKRIGIAQEKLAYKAGGNVRMWAYSSAAKTLRTSR